MPTQESGPIPTPRPNLRWIVLGLRLALVGYSCVALYGVLIGRLVWAERGPEVLVAVAAGVALLIARQRPLAAAWTGMLAVWLQLTQTVYQWGSFLHAGFIAYPLLVATTGLLLGRRAALVMGAVSVVGIPAAGFLGGATRHQLWANSGQQGLWLLVTILCIVVAALLTHTALKTYGEALADSERERARYLGLFENAPDGLLGLDGQGTILEANAAAATLLGLDRTVLPGRGITAVLTEAGIGRGVDVARAIEAQRLLELTVSRSQGDTVALEISVQRAPVPGGSTILMLRDITQRKLIEQRIGHAQRLEAVGQLAGGIAHDFNNLLTAIGGSAELIMMQPDAEARNSAAVILEAQRRGSTLTRQLLAFARRDVHQPQTIDLTATVTGLAKLVERVLGEQHRLQFVRAEPVAIIADAAQIEQVVLNLVTNARDAMPGGGTIQVNLGAVGGAAARALGSKVEAERQALLEVADTGTGIPRELLARIFEPFFTTKARGKGTGLGLAAVQGIVAQNQGCLVVDSAVGVGSKFRIFFPATRARPGEEPDAARPAAREPPAAARGSRGRILLVDDELLIRQSAARILERAGYEVKVAGHGEEALRLLAEAGPFRLMLTDLAMPGMTGRELSERIKVTHPDLPVVFMSGYFEEPGQSNAPPLGPVNFLPKPFSWEQLLRAVGQAGK